MMFKTTKTKKRSGKSGRRILGLIVLALVSTAAARGEEKRHSWNFALFGGGLFGQNGDVGNFVQAYDRYFQKWAEAYGCAKSNSLSWPSAGAEFGGEIGYSLSSRFSIGVAVERLSKNWEGAFRLGTDWSHSMEMKISALSISVLGRYTVPLTKTASIVFRAGIGTLSGSWDRTLERWMPDPFPNILLTADYSATGLTGQAGIGLEWDLAPWIALQLEGGYRLASLSKWSGDMLVEWEDGASEGSSGDLYYAEARLDPERVSTVTHPSLILGDPLQHGGTVSYRAFKADFSGFCFKAGFVFRIGR
jgi:hypothetical protein